MKTSIDSNTKKIIFILSDDHQKTIPELIQEIHTDEPLKPQQVFNLLKTGKNKILFKSSFSNRGALWCLSETGIVVLQMLRNK